MRFEGDQERTQPAISGLSISISHRCEEILRSQEEGVEGSVLNGESTPGERDDGSAPVIGIIGAANETPLLEALQDLGHASRGPLESRVQLTGIECVGFPMSPQRCKNGVVARRQLEGFEDFLLKTLDQDPEAGQADQGRHRRRIEVGILVLPGRRDVVDPFHRSSAQTTRLQSPAIQARLHRKNAFAQAKKERIMSADELVVCLGFPPFHAEEFLAQLRALPGVEAVILPIDEDGEWATVSPAEPFVEPPPWAQSVAAERRAVLTRANAIVTLHVPEHLLELAPHLRWIQGGGAGMEQFATAGARRNGVLVTNASGVSSASMAEWVVGRLLQVWKRFRDADIYQQQHAFERTYGASVKGKTIGIVGLGAIGCAVSTRMRAFDCRILGLKRSAGPGVVSEYADALYRPDQLHEMLAQCDAVVIAAPASPETHHMIDAEALAAMPSHAILVNVARGSLVDEVALASAMREGSIAAAVLDVFDPEPLDEASPLWDLPGVYVSAHSSVSVDRYMQDLFEFFLENLKRYLGGEELVNVLDLDALGFE